jgi:hypothetical protein
MRLGVSQQAALPTLPIPLSMAVAVVMSQPQSIPTCYVGELGRDTISNPTESGQQSVCSSVQLWLICLKLLQ